MITSATQSYNMLPTFVHKIYVFAPNNHNYGKVREQRVVCNLAANLVDSG